ncbi:glycoside hydrolase family 3 C-terminal domain-containing protein, partial [Bacillus cereus]|nr:glycoside hydrolase family 3 C-terminal domain-containing protein [Bacillus cereus]
LPQAQLELVKRLKTLNKPMVAVLFNGRPLDLHGVIEEADAVLEAWFPGGEGGAAIAELLYGDAEPTGRLTMSFPQSVGQVPVYYNHFNTGRPQLDPNTKERYVSQYLDVPNEPLFPFGYGLSYTDVAYDSVQLSGDTLIPGQELTIKVQVTNTGTRPVEETVQFYVRDISGDTVRPMKELKDFCKVLLAPGESREVEFALTEPQPVSYTHLRAHET